MSDVAPPPSRPGCLTELEVAQVRSESAGEVPAGIARHLATCERCQQRALFGAIRPIRKGRDASALPTPTRALILLGVMVAVLIVFFFTLHQAIAKP
jgi:hypothetical protein